MFILFGTSKIQKWNDPVEPRKDTGLNSVKITDLTMENGFGHKAKDIETADMEKDL